MLGYTEKEVETMMTTLNYTIHHHVKGKFAAEDISVLRQLEDLLEGLIVEGRI